MSILDDLRAARDHLWAAPVPKRTWWVFRSQAEAWDLELEGCPTLGVYVDIASARRKTPPAEEPCTCGHRYDGHAGGDCEEDDCQCEGFVSGRGPGEKGTR